jgi:hypothetical protein
MAVAATTDTPLPALTEVNITSLIGTHFRFTNARGNIDQIVRLLKRTTLRLPIVAWFPLLHTYIGSTFTFERNTYTIVDRIGDPSVYGTLFKIKKGNQEYVLKLQPDIPGAQSKEKNVIEGLIQHIVYESTKERNHFDCAYAPKMYGIFIMDIQSGNLNGVYTAYIQEKLTNTVKFFVQGKALSEPEITVEFVKLARKLQNLWAMYEFNHCDFHGGNAMYIEEGTTKSWRIIDFGKSLMKFNGNPLGVSTIDQTEYANESNEGRDLTHLMGYFKNNNLLDYRHEIPRYVLGIDDQTDMSFLEDTLAFERPIVTVPGVNAYWGAFTWFNTNNRPEGNAMNVLTTFNNVPPFITDTTICTDPSVPLLDHSIPVQNLLVSLGFVGLVAAVTFVTAPQFLQAGGNNTLVQSYTRNSLRNRKNRNLRTVKKLNNRVKGRNNKTKSMFRYNSSKYSVDNLNAISSEYIYDIIRFDVFPSVNPDELKDLLLTMIKVPIKKPSILKQVAASMNAGDFSSLVSVVQANRMENFENDLRAKGYATKFKHDYARIFAIYFSTQDRKLAIALLRYLLFFTCEDQENYDHFLNYVEGLNEQQRDAFIPKLVYNAYCI